MKVDDVQLPPRHERALKTAAANIIGIGDDMGIDLVEVLAAVEQYIIEQTKVGNAETDDEPVPAHRLGYTLREGRMVAWPIGRETSYADRHRG